MVHFKGDTPGTLQGATVEPDDGPLAWAKDGGLLFGPGDMEEHFNLIKVKTRFRLFL